MKYGFEKEYFVKRKGQFVLVPAMLPKDDCGYLAEARGEPHRDVMTAAHLMLAEEFKMKANAKGFQLLPIAFAVLPPLLLRQAIRVHGKNPSSRELGNIYGKDYSPTDEVIRAGLHVHFSNIREVPIGNGATVEVPQMIDFVKIIQHLDNAFKSEISAARRIPGLYELKAHGFKYRSLPASTDPRKVAKSIQEMKS